MGGFNGGEFINLGFASFCTRTGIAFTRSRADRKNDNCYVECRNDDAVRRFVGYARFATDEERAALAEVYRFAVPLMNYFLPGMKLVSKHREGAKVIKRNDTATPPYRRLLCSPSIPNDAKTALKAVHDALDIVELKLAYDAALGRLASLSKATSAAHAYIVAPLGTAPG